ncbi:MAG TPA: linear amide C-N hydrolase [Methylomirabilota bacterium]|nr:linear amide C-N hydrolase [Methylomirabilota bacterium]
MLRAAGKSRRLLALTGLGLAVVLTTPALSCTTVCLLDHGRVIVAYNYDFDPPEGLALVNKRGMRKVSAVRIRPATWTAAHGSVTFNQFGRDNPTTGINDSGLMVSLMWLDETRYPPDDERPSIGILEWIQYNLDRHASVADVLADADAVRPTSRVPIHYFFADATGDAATVEFLEGQLVVHRGSTMPVKALANSTYASSVAAFEDARRAGSLPTSRSSLDRFVRASMLAGSGGGDPIARGFEVLASVAQPNFTRWSVVYDLTAREIHFRTDGSPSIRRVTLAGLDFSCRTPVKMLDVTGTGSGDVTDAFVDYNVSANRALLEAAFTKATALPAVPKTVRDAAAAHPGATSVCEISS